MGTVRLRRVLRRAFCVLALCTGLFATWLFSEGWQALGAAAQGARRARMEGSPQWRGGRFVNPEPLYNDAWGWIAGILEMSPHASPAQALARTPLDQQQLRAAPSSGLRITWFGHSSMLVEIDGSRVLTDPLWSERPSPVGWLGPRRWFAPPIPLAALPSLDAVVISHDHYDHLDYETIRAMRAWDTKFVVPLGVGAHLEAWGVPPENIVELDWWQHTRVGELELVCTPARHASGRTLFDKDSTLWAGYALLGVRHRVYYSGDTGLFQGMREIGARLGPFDVTMIETGQYGEAWPDWHIGPEQAVLAHRALRGRLLLPVHWALLQLAYHGWTEPIERVLAAARQAQIRVLTPRPGQSLEPERGPCCERWWPDLPWKTALESPIVSTRVVPASFLVD